MAIIVSDDFNRANDPTGLGTATTGQVWNQVSGASGAWSVSSNTALWTFNFGDTFGADVIETDFTDAVTQVTLVNPTLGTGNFAIGIGLIARYVSLNFYWRLVYFRAPGPLNRLRLQRTYAGLTTSVLDINITLADNDTIALAYCGTDFEVFVNDVSQGTYDDSVNPQNYGTQSGLYGNPGSYFSTIVKNFDDFLVETNGTCTPTYNCTPSGCVDPGDGSGLFPTLAACLASCEIPETYNCVDGVCIDPGDGSGEFTSLAACQFSGCGSTVPEGVDTEIFDGGDGSEYYVVASITDSGNELRSKTVKSVKVTGRKTNASAMVYGYDINDPISVADLESGTRSNTRTITGPQSFRDSTDVTQSERKPVNITNAVLHTVRVAGDDTGNEERDRIDEIVLEQAIQGVRR